MRTIGFGCAMVISSVCLGSCGSSPSDAGKPKGGTQALADLTIDAGDIFELRGPGGGKLIGGDFAIRRARGNELRVPNATLGGACLVAQAEGVNDGRCTYDRQCDVTIGSGIGATKWHGYCIGSGGDVPTKRCWVKPPGNAYCVKQKTEGAYKIPAMDPSEVYRWANRGRRPVKWMVHGCLNGPVTRGSDPPCAGGPGQAIQDDGPPKAVRL